MAQFLKRLFTFRNRNHKSWFWFSLFFLLAALFYYFDFKSKMIIKSLAIVHGIISWTAFVVVKLKLPDTFFAPDCVWFNGVMTLVYLGLFLFL